jgi:hypothetical protein
MLERIHLALTPDELGQSTRSRALKPRAQWSEPRYLEDVDRLANALDRGRAQRLEGEISLAEPLRRLCCGDRSDRRQHPHPRREVEW